MENINLEIRWSDHWKGRKEKQNLSAVKAAYRQAVQDEKNADANKKFIQKCLEIMK